MFLWFSGVDGRGLKGQEPDVKRAFLACRAGIVPLDNTSDISGPLARSVEDVARMLEALAGPDPADPLTLSAPKNVNRTSNFTRYLNADGLKVSMPLRALKVSGTEAW